MPGRPAGRVCFPGLDSLRSYAALSAVITRITGNFAESRTRRADCLLGFARE